MNYLLVCFTLLCSLSLFAQDSDVRIKVIENKLDKIYKVRFGAMEEKTAVVSVLNVTGKVIQVDTLTGFGFEKQYDLNKLSNGMYTLQVEYGGNLPFTQDIFLESKKDVIKHSVAVEKGQDRIKVLISAYNTEPVSVFFLKSDGSSAGYDYLDNKNVKEKTYLLAKFPGATTVEIVQEGEVLNRESLPLLNQVAGL